MNCIFPGCTFFSDGGYCIRHKSYTKLPKPKLIPKSIPPISKKRKEENKAYNKAKKQIMSKGTRCKIKSPECTGKAEGADHVQKRSPKNFASVSNLVPACNACNLYKELHPKWALANGHSISRFKK